MEFLDNKKLYIILFSSTDQISKTIKCFESFCLKRKCMFSHVGILFHSDALSENFKKRICYINPSFLVVESTLSGELNDNVLNTCNRTKFGVQIRSLDQLISSYDSRDGKIAIAEISDIENFLDAKTQFSFILERYLDKNYECILTNLLTIHSPLPSIETKTYFCSELVFKILTDLGVIRKNNKSPKKISPNSLLNNVKIKEIIYLVA